MEVDGGGNEEKREKISGSKANEWVVWVGIWKGVLGFRDQEMAGRSECLKRWWQCHVQGTWNCLFLYFKDIFNKN
jgi:hypothetical protein